MQDETIMPVRHGVLSGTATTAAEAGKGGLSGLFKAGGITFLAGAGLTVIGTTALALTSTFSIPAVLGVIAVAGLGTIATVWATGFAGTIGGVVGGVNGASRGAHRVSQERGAATVLDAQVAAAQAQAVSAQTNVYAHSASNDNKYNFPAQGSAMNQAATTFQKDGASFEGRAADQQLQRA
jgi:hypothetical protein